MQANGQLGRHDHLTQGQRMGGPTHILFHQSRARRAFHVYTARIERDAFADDGQSWMGWIAPFNLGQTRRFMRGAPDRMDHGVVFNQKVLPNRFAVLSVIFLREILHRLRQSDRSHIAGWRVDQIAAQFRRLHGGPNGIAINIVGNDQPRR